MQGGVAEQFMAELQRFQEIGVKIAALTQESSELRKRLMTTYEAHFGKIADKQAGEFFVGDRLFTFSRDVTGKEINILFRDVPRIKLDAIAPAALEMQDKQIEQIKDGLAEG